MATLTDILKIAGTLENAEAMARDMAGKDEQFLLDLQLILSARGKIEESKKLIDFLSERLPDDNRIAFNRGWHVLNEGDLQGGLALLDRGRFENVFGSPALPGKLVWDFNDTEAKGKTILLRGEGGLGDEIANVRFAEAIAKRGNTVLVSCQPSLQSLFSRVPGVSKAVAHADLKPEMYDAWVPAMSAARFTKHTYETLPGQAFIKPQQAMIEKWQKIIPKHKGVLRVGIRWSGNPQFEHEQFRRFPVEPLLALAKIPGIKLYSLQRDHDLRTLPPEIQDLSREIATWEDTAGAIANLDLVISSCTSIAHLAGAMGKETWVLVPIMPYYIWAMPGDKSPWYESVTIFRQEVENDWHAPLAAVAAALRKKAGQDTITLSKPMNHSEPRKKTLHLMAGLPRSGSTMLISLLAQNPEIFGAPVSGLCGIVSGVNANWDKIEFHKEVPNERAKINILRAILDSYHQTADRPIIMDKERHWVRQIALLEKVLERPVKIIVPVRPVVEILTSFEQLRQKNPLTFTVVDEQLAERSTLANRCEYFMNEAGPVGTCYNYIRDAVISGFHDRLLFIDYNKFVRNPKRDLDRIYAFLGLPSFEHRFENIPQLVESDDSVWRYPGLHKVRPALKRISADPLTVLGPELVARYTRVEPWEQWT